MKRTFVTIGYLLWVIAFLPTAVIVAALVGLPYFLAVYHFSWINQDSAFCGMGFYFCLFMGLLTLPVIDKHKFRDGVF